MIPSVPPVTWALIVANTAIYILQLGASDGFIRTFALWPLGASPALGPDALGAFQPWQLVTYSFLHGSFTHLFLNMLALFMFGSEIERLFGTRRYLVYYFAAVLAAALTQIVVSTATGSFLPARAG